MKAAEIQAFFSIRRAFSGESGDAVIQLSILQFQSIPHPPELMMRISEAIALILERRLASDPAYEPPTIDSLSREFRVARKTISAALADLSKRGIISVSRGARTRRTGSDAISPHSAAGKLYADVRKKIQDGVFRASELFPKFDSIAAEYHVARVTVASVAQRLSNDRLIHKKGRRWMVGPRPAQGTQQLSTSPLAMTPVVLLLCTDTKQSVFHNLLIQPFWESLQQELHQNDTSMRLGYRIPEASRSPIQCQGMEEVLSSIRQWGDFYRGTLVYDQHCEADTLALWARRLSCSGARPVIYFDLSDSRPMFTRPELSLGDFFYRMHLDEPGAVDLALRQLVGAGHRTIGLPTTPWDTSDWVLRRTRLAEKIARGCSPRPTIVTVPLDEPFWDPTSPFSKDRVGISDAILQYLQSRRSKKGSSGPHTSPTSREILHLTPSMATLKKSGATAILALNDWLAHQIFGWCHMAGIDVPADMSLISFDNDPIALTYPVTTIDFGFARLGYLAARVLCGARIPEADREGNVPGICTVVNHGSVARPPKAG